MARSRTVRSEAGFALIEVLVSAAVLAMISMAVLAGIDGASGSTGRESARAVAASLAEQDQERLRSMTIDPVANTATQTRTVTVDKVDYKVVSTTRWVKDDTGDAPSCTAGATESDYVSITSTVTSNVTGTRTKPVTLQSLYSPPVKYRSGTGTLAVQVNNRDSLGVAAINVHVAGTSTGTVTRDALTNSVGCALFQYVPAGNYTVSTTRSGWVDKAGNSPASKTTTLTAGTVGLVSLDYDQAAGATLTIKTFTPGTTTQLASSSIDAAEINPGAAALRKFPLALPANPTATVAATNLFPFKDAYTFWTGSCAGENPASYTANSTYFTGAGNHALPTNPGGIYTIDVFQPPLNLRVTHDANNKIIGGSGATRSTDAMSVNATYLPPASDTGCSDTVDLNLVTRADIATNANGWLSQQPSSFDPGIPFGKWQVCVVDLTKRKHITLASYDNTIPAGQSSTADLATSSTAYATGTTC